jgi:hypothetical protein
MNKIKLFQTVADLHSRGKVDLTTAERTLIEKETADLIRKSQHYRTAAKAPEGFSDLLLDLAKMDADEAYTRVVEFLGESGLEVETEDEEENEDERGPVDKPEDESMEGDDDKGGPPMMDKKDESSSLKPPMPSELEKGDEEGSKPKPPEVKDNEDDKDDNKEKDKEKKKEDGKKEDKEAKRKALIAQAQELNEEKVLPGKGPGMGPGKGPGMVPGRGLNKGPGKGMGKEKKMLELEEEEGLKKGQDMVDMGMGEGTPVSSMQAARSKKIKVRVTASGNLVASHEDIGPLFHAVPRNEVKKNPTALKRLANKVYGLIVFEGARVAARKCGTRLLAGVDDDIETTGGEVPPETEGVTEEADFDSRETPDDISMSDESLDDADFDTQETPDKVDARRKRPVARYRRTSGSGDKKVLSDGNGSFLVDEDDEALKWYEENGWEWEETGRGVKQIGDDELFDDVEIIEGDADGSCLVRISYLVNEGGARYSRVNYIGEFYDGELVGKWEEEYEEDSDKESHRRPVARYKRLSGVEDDAEVVTEMKPDPKPDSTSNGGEIDAKEGLPSVSKDSLGDAEFDIKVVEGNYKKLYQARAKKMAEKANREFVERFAKAIKVASMRMAANMDEHPLKAAALDILTEDNVAFSNGDIYNPMDVGTATELIELFSSEGHTAFVDHLLERTADLMERTPEYLDDTYQDLKNIQPIPIQVEQGRVSRKAASHKVARERNAAHEGNVGIPLISGASAAPKSSNNVKDAIGETKVTRRLGSMYR